MEHRYRSGNQLPGSAELGADRRRASGDHDVRRCGLVNGQRKTGELHEKSLPHRRKRREYDTVARGPDPEEDVLEGAIREGDLAADGVGVVWGTLPEADAVPCMEAVK